MAEHLYFAADLRRLVVALPDGYTPPPAIWVLFADATERAAAWLLTPETYARVLWQAHRLHKRHEAGDYPADQIARLAESMRPIQEWAFAHIDYAARDQAWAKLEAGGGPRRPLPQPPAASPNPFDAPGSGAPEAQKRRR